MGDDLSCRNISDIVASHSPCQISPFLCRWNETGKAQEIDKNIGSTSNWNAHRWTRGNVVQPVNLARCKIRRGYYRHEAARVNPEIVKAFGRRKWCQQAFFGIHKPVALQTLQRKRYEDIEESVVWNFLDVLKLATRWFKREERLLGLLIIPELKSRKLQRFHRDW